MHQEAIRVTRDNVSDIAETLFDYSAQDILDECNYMLNASINVVLVTFVFNNGERGVSHIVSESMFYANASATLNDKFFEKVTQL